MKGWGLVGPAYSSEASLANGEVLLNWYLEFNMSPHSRAPLAMVPTPGLRSVYTGMESPIRAQFEQDGRSFVVGGGKYYEIHADDTITELGSVASDGSPAVIVCNGEQNLVLSGGRGYIHTLDTDAFAIIADADFPTDARQAVYLDEYFIVLTDAGVILYSALNDGTSWDALDIIVKSRTSDQVLAIAEHQSQLWLFGSKNIEVWANTGDALNPFQPVPGVKIEQGIDAIWSLSKAAGSLCFIGRHSEGAAVVYRTVGYGVEPISDHALAYQLAQASNLGGAEAFTYQQFGHTFYVLNLSDRTWVADPSLPAGMRWHQRAYLNPNTGQLEAHLGRTHAYAFGKHWVGSRRDGVIYELSTDVYTDDGSPIRRVRESPNLGHGRRRTFYGPLWIEMEVGVGLASGFGSAPTLILQISNDGGRTWSSEREATIGAMGHYDTIVEFRQMGSSVGTRKVRIVGTHPVPYRILDGDLPMRVTA